MPEFVLKYLKCSEISEIKRHLNCILPDFFLIFPIENALSRIKSYLLYVICEISTMHFIYILSIFFYHLTYTIHGVLHPNDIPTSSERVFNSLEQHGDSFTYQTHSFLLIRLSPLQKFTPLASKFGIQLVGPCIC